MGQPGRFVGQRGHWCTWCWTCLFWGTERGIRMHTGPDGLQGLSLLIRLVCSTTPRGRQGGAGIEAPLLQMKTLVPPGSLGLGSSG